MRGAAATVSRKGGGGHDFELFTLLQRCCFSSIVFLIFDAFGFINELSG